MDTNCRTQINADTHCFFAPSAKICVDLRPIYGRDVLPRAVIA